LLAAGPGGQAEGPRGGIGTAAPRCSGDDDDDGETADSAGPSRAVQLQEDKLGLVNGRHKQRQGQTELAGAIHSRVFARILQGPTDFEQQAVETGNRAPDGVRSSVLLEALDRNPKVRGFQTR
jgi:hypothetical protein